MAKKRKKSGGSKPRSQWSKPYRRRVERAEAKGLSRQAARGHKPREHISRKEAKGLTAAQSHAVDTFARKQAGKVKRSDGDEASRRLKAWAREQGYERFQALRDLQAARQGESRERFRERDKKGRVTVHISVGHHDLAADFEAFDLPDMPGGDDFGWFYYH